MLLVYADTLVPLEKNTPETHDSSDTTNVPNKSAQSAKK